MTEHDPERRRETLRPDAGTFDFREGPPFAVSYLRTYYNQPPTADETAVWRFLMKAFREHPPRGRFLELGCGPTVHHILPFAPHVDEIRMSDYLEENLEQVRLWKAGAPEAHDWSAYTSFTLECEGVDPTPEAIAEREALARGKLDAIFPCNLMQDVPAEHREAYDAVGAFYCVEEIGISVEEWRRVLERATDHVRPGGTFYMSALAGMTSYDVMGVDYPCACIRHEDVRRAFDELGFGSVSIESSEIETPDCGVTGSLNVAAVK